jgi:hypothetical protein
VEPGAAAVPVEDAEVLLQGQKLAEPPALVQERKTGARLNDEERRETLGGRLHHEVRIPANGWHPGLRGGEAQPEDSAGTRP